ncbi:DUF6597 domain-containing transcriptional factor [Hymenobacter guriensis]|uniref:Helix-turn-helix domain-containing protein n=1 Tax=Hymenobacter guriensis TaxID=2793065 RepID=A0ABS0L4R1_9BACT|nr:DUF6597 domain-containing transcriptional factor [Hymenobacter guriensis]MBG8555130.1 helix-turn-helix domain-containing protein [Hymenobacter guriensis]
MQYQEFAPSPALAPLVVRYWQFQVPESTTPQPVQHTVLPDGCVSLVWMKPHPLAPPEVVWAGPRTQNFQLMVWPGSTFAGIRFVPGIPYALFGLDMAALKNASVPAAPWLQQFPALRALADQLATTPLQPTALDELLAAWPPVPTDQLTQSLVARILTTHGKVRISELVQAAHLSERQVQKRFKQAVGLTMKELARIRRLRATVIQLLLAKNEYFGTLEEAGYFDQAHFSHEFTQSAGTSVRAFQSYIEGIEHTDVTA